MGTLAIVSIFEIILPLIYFNFNFNFARGLLLNNLVLPNVIEVM